MLDARFHKYYLRGHIPTSKSLPLTDVLTEDYCYKKPEELIKVIQNLGIKNPREDEVILTC